MKCLLCKSDTMVESTTSYVAKLETCYIIIENVPCMKCTQCEEVVFSASVMERIEDIIEQVQNVASKIFIMDYRQAA